MGVTQKAGKQFSVYLDNSRIGTRLTAAYVFDDPVAMVIAQKGHEVGLAFEQIRRYLAEGYYAAGWISYEAGLFLEKKLESLARPPNGVPLLSFGIYQKRITLTSDDNEDHWAQMSHKGDYAIENMQLSLSRGQYAQAVAKIHDYLDAGDVYQVNFTLKAQFDFSGSPESYFIAMRKAQKVEYGAFIKAGDFSILSLSPELFFKKTGQKITVRPMKGTYRRGRSTQEDQKNAEFLNGDDKNRAENLMIVDLLRNDLAKISRKASVKLISLYDVEKYRTLFQMTSTIECELSEQLDAVDLVQALFPCGSVTGAPKIRAMEIISELETSSRGIYTGAIGYMAPDGNCCFSVPIRTVTVTYDRGRNVYMGEMGIGSAIVADSNSDAEYKECLLKAQFATRKYRDFDLIESLRWCSGGKSNGKGYYLLALHMARLKSSADYFDFIYDEQAILEDLDVHASYLDSSAVWKVRLLLSPLGNIAITSVALEDGGYDKALTITLSQEKTDSENPMSFHKTTDRGLYNQQLRAHKKDHGSYDVVFLNEKGELTEGVFNNIFLKQGDIFYTPPLECGVLNGTLRQSMMADVSIQLIEKTITLLDLRCAEDIYMGNSVRGLVRVVFREP